MLTIYKQVSKLSTCKFWLYVVPAFEIIGYLKRKADASYGICSCNRTSIYLLFEIVLCFLMKYRVNQHHSMNTLVNQSNLYYN